MLNRLINFSDITPNKQKWYKRLELTVDRIIKSAKDKFDEARNRAEIEQNKKLMFEMTMKDNILENMKLKDHE